MTRVLLLLLSGLAACAPVVVSFPLDTATPDGDTGTPDTDTAVDSDTDSGADTDSGGDTACADLWYADADGDRYGDAGVTTTGCEAPDGYVGSDADCDDTTALSHPGLSEVCDGIDNDCDGNIDELGATGGDTWYRDDDGDGFGDPAAPRSACSQPAGFVVDATDCDDTDAAVFPGSPELPYDHADNDCDGRVDTMDAAAAAGWTVLGVGANDGIGAGGATATGDLDGDGFAELVIAAPLYGTSDSGAVAFSGTDTAALDVPFDAGELVTGRAAGDRFGTSVALLGDVDGDGADDLAVGAPLANGEQTDVGAVYVFDRAGAGVTASVTSLADATFVGGSTSGWVGMALASGDLDGDGLPDLAIGATGESSQRGRVYVLASSDGAWWRQSTELGDEGYRLRGLADADAFGTAVTFAGDVTADGYDELVACAPGYDDPADGAGGCWLVSGSAFPRADGDVDVYADASFTGTAAGDALGYAPAALAAADLDGDGTPDLALGAPGHDGSTADGGAVGVWSGGAIAGAHDLAGADLLVSGDGALGRALSTSADSDGDGIADLFAGAPTAGGAGTIYLLTGIGAGAWTLPGAEAASWVGTSANDAFGTTFAGAADLDGDGTIDLAAAATANDDAASNVGKVYVLPGYP
jgi:hypothetical protein